MKKASKYLAVLLSLLMLVSMASVSVSAAEYILGRLGSDKYTTAPTATAHRLTTPPKMDGKIDKNEYGPKQFTMTKDYLINGKGLVWVNVHPTTQKENTPVPVTADVYMAWDSEHFYFAMELKNVKEHYNAEMINEYLWKGDCLQIQIAESVSANRYELGFAYSSGRKSQLSYQWFPTPGETGLERQKDYMAIHKSGTTVYEIALPVSYFSKKTDLFKPGAKIPFSFALHVYDKNDPVYEEDTTGGISPGCFYEWAQGVVGGTMEKQITSAATIILGDGGGGEPITTTTTTTIKTSGGGTSTTPQKTTGTGTGTETAPITTGTTTASTTITEPIDKDVELLPINELAPVEDAIIKGLVEAEYQDQQVEVSEIAKSAGKKYAIHEDQLLDMYYVEDGELKAIAYNTGDDGVRIYDTDALPDDVEMVYVVAEAPATEEPSETTEGTATATTTAASTTDAIGTTGDAGDTGGGNNTWLIILIVAVVVIGGGVGAFFFIKKKQQA